jgi:hypothetical protein
MSNATQHRRTRIAGLVDPRALGTFTPAQISGCQVWLAADKIVGLNDGDSVSSWADQSGNGRDFAQASATLKPLYKTSIINGNPVVRFDGSDDYLNCALASGGFSAYAIALVVRPLAAESAEGLFQWASVLSSGTPYLLIQRNSTTVRFYNTNAAYQFTTTHATNATRLYILTWNGTTWTLYVDGGSPSSVNTSGFTAGTTIYLGNGYAGYANVDLAEFVLYDAVPPDADRANLTAYLKSKYGIA